MPIQEQEERDFFPQSEMQMCVEEAKHARYVRNQQEATKIQAAINPGNFVVVRDITHYCHATDAVTSSITTLHSTHRSRQDADAVVAADQPYEDYAYVLPHLPPPASILTTDDNVPF